MEEIMLDLMKYRCLQMLREKIVMFWALCFPIILGTMFHFAFGNLSTPNLDPISVAVVVMQEEEQNKQFQNFAMNATEILDAKIMDTQSATQQLEDGKIDGIYETGTTHSLTVTKSTINTSILQTLLETYQRNEHMIMEIAANRPAGLSAALEEIADYKSMTEKIDMSGNAQDTAMPYFLALIGMACLYGCFLGLGCPINMQANLSALGARRSITPTHRLKLIIADMLATFAIHFANVVILLGYLHFILQVNLGANAGAILLVSAIGSLVGVAIGMFVGSLGKFGEEMKIGIILGVSMVCSFLAGLMVHGMKDIIEKHAPLINRINPAALIADAFYSLSIYKDMDRYYRNIWILLGISILLVVLSFLMVRRERYDNI